jgi:hypothetical protein
MVEEYYEKCVTGHWFNPLIKQTIEVFAITYEMSQKPYREEILAMELLKDYPDAGNFDYIDDEKLEYEEGMPLYPQIEVGSANRREITDDS